MYACDQMQSHILSDGADVGLRLPRGARVVDESWTSPGRVMTNRQRLPRPGVVMQVNDDSRFWNRGSASLLLARASCSTLVFVSLSQTYIERAA